MRTISFILAFAVVLAGPSMAGSSHQDLPGIGSSPGAPADGCGGQLSVGDS